MENKLVIQSDRFQDMEKIISTFYEPLEGYTIIDNNMAIYKKYYGTPPAKTILPFPFNNTKADAITRFVQMWLESPEVHYHNKWNGDGSSNKGFQLVSELHIHSPSFPTSNEKQPEFHDRRMIKFLIRPFWIYYPK
jgi:hypothetical protein